MNFHRISESASSTKKLALLFPTLLGLACLAPVGACSSSSTGTAAETPGTEADASDAAPTSTAGLGAIPCDIKTGFAGDNMCIKAPAPEVGFQFHYGPSDYKDAAEVAKYTLKPGQEVTDCVFFPTPNDKDVFFSEYHSRMRPGSHHMLFYIQDAKITETGKNGPTDCSQGIDTRNLFGAQTAKLDILGDSDGAPENRGAAVRIPAHQQGVMQLHFINAGKTDLLREAWANVIYVDKSKVTQLGDPIFFIAGFTMNVKMGDTTIIHGTATVPADAAPDFRLLSATPHFHAHTSRFTAYATIGGQKQKILEDYGTLGVPPEPTLYPYDSKATNPEPNETARLSGASTGILSMKPGDTIDWECEVQNDDVPQGIKWGNAVFTGEMCNLFGDYAPTDGSPWRALNP